MIPSGLHHAQAAGDTALYEEIIRLNRSGSPSALATIIECSGSTPRKTGSKMLIRADGSILGSVGGGAVEQEAIATALAVIQKGTPRIVVFELTREFGYACGGNLRLFIEPNRIEPRLIIIGAGHIGTALAPLARFAGFHVTVVDERADYACAQRLPDADAIINDTAPAALQDLNIGAATAVVIATYGHAQDFEAARAALKTSAGFIGVLGSRRKKRNLDELLAREGYAAEAIGRVIMPVGVAIGAETPQEIAVSIVAQLIMFGRDHAAFTIGHHSGGGAVAPHGSV